MVRHSDDLALNKEIITFSSTSHCLYALSATQPDQISTTRIHPQDSRTKIPICTTTLNRPSRQDPLIACIFPKLAGLMALDKSSTAAVEQGLDRQTSALLQADAINKAQEKEGSMLLWDYDSNRFCIMHPTLLDDSATTMRIDITPTPTSPETITIFAPETDTPLLELEMTTLALQIHGSVIAALPSLYILDTLMTALLILLLHLHRSCADPANRHSPHQQQQTASSQSRTSYDVITDDPSSSLYFPPPPPSLHSQASKRDLRRPTSSRLSAFRSVRSVKSSRSLAPSLSSTRYGDAYDKDIELGDLDPHTGLEASPSSAMASKSKSKPSNKKQKAPKGLVDVDDPGLPKGTRAVLRFLYWGFEVLFWVVGTLMQVAAAAVVGAGKFVTKL